MEKVLLLNFSQKEADQLTRSVGLVFHRGYIGSDPGTLVSRDGSREDAPPSFYSPESIYEYAAIFINLDKSSAVKEEYGGKVKLWQDRDRKNLFNYWHNNNRFVAIYLGESSYAALDVLGIPVDLQDADSTDTTCLNWPVGDYETEFRSFIARSVKQVAMPGRSYLKFTEELLRHNDPCVREVYGNANSDVVGAYIDNVSSYADVDKPICMLLPQFKDLPKFTADLIHQLDKISSLFPSLKDKQWAESDEYLPSSVKKFDDDVATLKSKYELDLAKLKAEQIAAKAQYSHLVGMLEHGGDELVADVEWALSEIIGLKVTDSDTLLKNRTRKEDLAIEFNSKLYLAEVKGTVSQNPSPKYASQLLTHALLNRRSDREIAGCLLIVNYDYETSPHKRIEAYSGDLEGVIETIIFLDTRVLHAITLDVIEAKLKKKDAQKLLFDLGRISYTSKA